MKPFLFLYCINYSLVKRCRKIRLTMRLHGNKKQLASSTFSAETVENVIKFIMNTAEEQALLPSRVTGFKRINIELLPWILTKHSLWKTYTETSQGQLSVAYSKFCDLWKQLCLFVLIMRRATELCWNCQKNHNLTQKTANLPETQKGKLYKLRKSTSVLEKVLKHKILMTTCKKMISALKVNLAHIMELYVIL